MSELTRPELEDIADSLGEPLNGRMRLDRLARAVRFRRPIPEDVRDWLIAGIAAFALGESLEFALGLKPSVPARRERDDALACMLSTMPAQDAVSWRLQMVRKAAKHLQRAGHAMDADTLERSPTWKVHLARAIAAAPLPSDRTLREICKRADSAKNGGHHGGERNEREKNLEH